MSVAPSYQHVASDAQPLLSGPVEAVRTALEAGTPLALEADVWRHARLAARDGDTRCEGRRQLEYGWHKDDKLTSLAGRQSSN